MEFLKDPEVIAAIVSAVVYIVLNEYINRNPNTKSNSIPQAIMDILKKKMVKK